MIPDPNSREVGVRVLEVAKSTLEALGVWSCCQIHGMTAEAFSQLIEGCSQEMRNPRLRLYIQLYVTRVDCVVLLMLTPCTGI